MKLSRPWCRLSRLSEVKGHGGNRKLIYGFLSVDNSNNMPRKHHYGATAISNFHDLGVGCQGHLRSNVKVEIESSHVVSYLLVIVTICLGSTIKDLEQF